MRLNFWEAKPGQTFSMYLRTAVRHAQAHDQQQGKNGCDGFRTRDEPQDLKKRWSTWRRTELQRVSSVVTREKEQVIADIVGVGVKTLREALRNKQSVLSLDDTGGEDSALGDPGGFPSKKAWKSRWSRAVKCWHGCTAA